MHRNIKQHQITLASGQVLAPGEDGKADLSDPHDKAHWDAGNIIETDEPNKAANKKKGEAK